MRTVVLGPEIAKAVAIAAWRDTPASDLCSFDDILAETTPYYEGVWMTLDNFVAAYGRDMVRHVKTVEAFDEC